MKFAAIGFAVATATWIATGRTHDGHDMNIKVARHASSREAQSERWNWSGRIPAGKTIEIRGINGDVSAEPATGTEVEVVATKRGRRSDPDEVRMEVIEHEGGVTICAVYPGDRNHCAAGGGRMNTRNNDVEVNFTVRIPRGVGFDGNTVNGDVEAMGMTGDVEVSSVNGSVRMETEGGNASATSVNGAVTAVVRSIGQRALRFKSVNGSVNVTLPANIDVNVEARTVNGSIDTDFPITVNGRMTARRVSGTIGRGGRELDLETVNGSIRLRKIL